MLDYLHIRGLALLDDVALEFEPGMNVLTGETGAGKSIIVDALALLRGARGRGELVREGDEAARVEAQFTVREGVHARLGGFFDTHDLDLENGQLVVERKLKRSGRGRAAVQSNLTTLSVLSELGGELLEICSQHEHHSLTHVGHHLELLDAHAELDGPEGPLERYAAEYRGWRALVQRVEDIRDHEAERLQRADYLRFQIEELERVAPEPGEHEALRERLTLLRDAHELGRFSAEAHQLLYERDDAIASRLAVLLDRARRLGEGKKLAALDEMAEQLESAQIAAEEAASAAARMSDAIECGPGELEQVQDRVHELERLRRKHGCDIDELLERVAAMGEELESLEGAEEQLGELEAEALSRHRRCLALADELHERRAAAAGSLARAVEAELTALHIPNARLAVAIQPFDARSESDADEAPKLGPRGRDRAELRFSANPGEPLAPLTKVASGGELSRVLLAVKSVLSTEQRVSTYVFDEVDAGVGGAVAEAIGSRLRKAASHHQVLCITHLPQIAAFADAHFRVQKQVVDGRTVTRVVALDEDARVEELARMLGGKRVTASAREHARALIDEARRWRSAGKSAKKKTGKATKAVKKKATKVAKKPSAKKSTATKPAKKPTAKKPAKKPTAKKPAKSRSKRRSA
ncbi:DNA repair protein RecN [Plesiocystis pacifica SIR-1]|uniref:DNA repair protein RecN n=1 Tax=Plesiocystis pacifica SIR-1 TaxID=391625 RepID=A6GCB3_9BACT|nr:DNA repair protein RecN [Plesiocystis pacifica]EDM76472.1 DNA repair protein RecN [Plesiocystis pacifica SIR-1]